MDHATLSNMATVLLADVVTDLGPTAPAHRVIQHGIRFAHDCEMVAVGIGQFGFDPADKGPFPGHQRAIYLPTVQFQVMWIRAWPSVNQAGELPTAAKITAASLALAVDVSAVGDGITTRWQGGTLWGLPAKDIAHLVTVGPILPISPEGGMAGWRVTVGARL